MLKHVRYEITLDEIAGCVIAVSNYSNIGEKIGNTTRRKETFAGFEPSTNRDEGDQVNTELLLSQSSNKNFLHIMLLSFEIGFLGV